MAKPYIVVPNQFDDADEESDENQFLEIAARIRQISPAYDHEDQITRSRKVTPIDDDQELCRCACSCHGRKIKDSASIVSADSNQEDHFRPASTIISPDSNQEYRPTSHFQHNQVLTSNETSLRNKTISIKLRNLPETDESSLECDNVLTAPSEGRGFFSVPPGITQDDVLCGRGKGANNFIGNRRFRDLVMTFRDAYSKCTRRSEKREICYNIVQAIRFRGGKFLTKDEKHGDTTSSPMGGWIPLDDEKVIVKVSQALREGVAKWNKATQRYQEAKSKKVTLLPNALPKARQGDVARWNKAKVKYEEAKVKTVALQSSAPAIALLAEISALQA